MSIRVSVFLYGKEISLDGEIGRHKRLKISRSQGHAGSIPASRTKQLAFV